MYKVTETYVNPITPRLVGVLVSKDGQEPRHSLERGHDPGIQAILHTGYRDGGADKQALPVGP